MPLASALVTPGAASPSAFTALLGHKSIKLACFQLLRQGAQSKTEHGHR
jgi:hypothetical protein